jgi:hypothetical protein
MPTIQVDGAVVWMRDPTPNVNARVSPHDNPAELPQRWLAAKQLGVLLLRDPIRVLWTHVDVFTAHAVNKLAAVRLSSASPQRFVPEDLGLINNQARNRNEEPLPLANESLVLPAIPGSRTNALSDQFLANQSRLERFHRRPNGGGRSRNSSDEPRLLIVAAQEPLLLDNAFIVLSLGQKQQVPVLRARIQGKDILHYAVIDAQIEILASAVSKDIDPEIAAMQGTRLRPSADVFKLPFQNIMQHSFTF